MSNAPPDTGPGHVADRMVCPRGLRSFLYLAILFPAIVLTCGCTPWREFVQNGFKVGPNYHKPPAPVAKDWIDAGDKRVRTESDDLSKWWTVFNDPVLDSLICSAYRQNLSLRVAGMRVLQARAQLAIDVGNLLPQTQTATGDFKWNGLSKNTANNFLQFGIPPGSLPGVTFPNFRRWYGQWDQGFNLSWELDFWGRFRRAVEADSASLDASVENYDDVLVTLLGQVATNYTQMRITEQRIKYTQDNVELQRETLAIAEARFKNGTVTKLDVAQARSTMEQTQATIPELAISLRQFNNQLCILLGIPPGRVAGQGRPEPHPDGTRGGGGRHPGRNCCAGARMSEKAEPPGRLAVGPDRRGRGRLLPPYLHQRHVAVFGRVLQESLDVQRPERRHRPYVHVEHPQLWAHPE